jgi:Trehalose utilisation
MDGMLDCLPPRRYFMHSAHRTIGLSAVAALADLPLAPATSPQPRSARVGIVNREEDGWPTSVQLLARFLAEADLAECSPAWEHADRGIDDGTDYDCLLLLGWPASSGPRRLKRIEHHCRGGGSLLALRATSAALPGWPSFAEDVLGGRDRDTAIPAPIAVSRSQNAWYHPLVAGVEPFLAKAGAYRGPRLAPDTTVLMVGQSGGREKPVAWARRHRGGRIFASTLGSEHDFRQASFLRLLANAIRWASAASM